MACSKQLFCTGETDIAQNRITITALRIRAKIFMIRFLGDVFLRRAFLFLFSRSKARSIGHSIIFFCSESRNYSPQTLSVEAIFFVFFILLYHLVTLQNTAAASFLRSSCDHPQDQTVPSTSGAAPCPVVTPSHYGLGSAFSADTVHYIQLGITMLQANENGYNFDYSFAFSFS